jgi:hypothetical protein
MAEHGCATCAARARYDRNPRALLARLWRWHTNWCPGWKAYMQSLPPEERRRLARQYNQKKFEA